MRLTRRIAWTAAAVVASFALAGPASAATISNDWTVTGVEIGHFDTTSWFAGVGSTAAGDKGLWVARVSYTALADGGSLTGGSFSMAARAADDGIVPVTGSISGGTISALPGGTGCVNESWHISGTLANVSVGGSTGGAGSFDVTLTHKRVPIFGRCVAFGAAVTGSLTLSP